MKLTSQSIQTRGSEEGESGMVNDRKDSICEKLGMIIRGQEIQSRVIISRLVDFRVGVARWNWAEWLVEKKNAVAPKALQPE